MALIQCPECKGEVSDQAASCPHCGYPMQKPAVHSTPSSDDTLRQLLTHGNKLAAIKLYRDHHPGASLSAAKEYVDRLQASMPPALGGARGGSCLLLLCLCFALAPSVAFWSHFHRSPATPASVLPLVHR